MAAPEELLVSPVSLQSETEPRRKNAGAANSWRQAWFTWSPMLFVGLFAGLLASFPIRNVDLWQHLAAGRDIVHGDLSFLTSTGAAPLGPGWLFDVVTYVLYAAVGGAG